MGVLCFCRVSRSTRPPYKSSEAEVLGEPLLQLSEPPVEMDIHKTEGERGREGGSGREGEGGREGGRERGR